MSASRPVQIRGTLPAGSLGARGIEHIGRNPSCTRLAVLAAASLAPATVLKNVYDRPDERRPSPLAVSLGDRYEKHVFKGSASELLQLYRAQGRLSASENKVVDIDRLVPGNDEAALRE